MHLDQQLDRSARPSGSSDLFQIDRWCGVTFKSCSVTKRNPTRLDGFHIFGSALCILDIYPRVWFTVALLPGRASSLPLTP